MGDLITPERRLGPKFQNLRQIGVRRLHRDSDETCQH